MMEKRGTEVKAIALMIFCTIFTSGGQLFWKTGVGRIDFSNLITLFNWPFILGFFAYGTGALLMILAFRFGELSVLYPIVASSYVWVSLASLWFFPDDRFNVWKLVGVVVILISVSLLGWGSTRKSVEKVEAKVEVDG